MEAVELADVFAAAGGEIAPGGLYAGVAEDVGEAHDVAGLLIVGDGEKTAQIVGKDAVWVDAGPGGDALEQGPDLIT